MTNLQVKLVIYDHIFLTGYMGAGKNDIGQGFCPQDGIYRSLIWIGISKSVSTKRWESYSQNG